MISATKVYFLVNNSESKDAQNDPSLSKLATVMVNYELEEIY